MKFRLSIKSSQRSEFIDITRQLQSLVTEKQVLSGQMILFVPHTTAGVTINEGADPAVKIDMLNILESMVPNKSEYSHAEGNSDSHLKASLMGSSETVFVDSGKLSLGTWQSIYFCEFDGPRERFINGRIYETKEEIK